MRLYTSKLNPGLEILFPIKTKGHVFFVQTRVKIKEVGNEVSRLCPERVPHTP